LSNQANAFYHSKGLLTRLVRREDLTGEESSETSMHAELRQIFLVSLSGVSIVDGHFSSAAGESIAFVSMKFQKILLSLWCLHYPNELPLLGFGC
jgi:hypothetical protein